MADRVTIVPEGIGANPAFSPGVRVGEFLFISGQVAQDGNGNTVGVGDCAAQTRQVMSRIQTIVQAAGATLQDVVKITTFLINIDDYPAFSQVRSATFPTSPPASSTVIVAGLVRPDFLVEVEAVVHIPT
jgi:enamine deaminase RidA (YjgF/YER057c/UK114 family)